VASATPLCLRQQGTSALFYRGFLPGRAKILDKRKNKVPLCRRPRPCLGDNCLTPVDETRSAQEMYHQQAGSSEARSKEYKSHFCLRGLRALRVLRGKTAGIEYATMLACRRHHHARTFAEADPRMPRPLAHPPHDHLVAILEEPAQLAGGQFDRLRAPPCQLQQAAA
jgi:hypothetical protein